MALFKSLRYRISSTSLSAFGVIFLSFVGLLLLVDFGEARRLGRQKRDTDADDEDSDDTSGRVSLGSFESYAHDFGGEATLIDDKTLEITGLTYDGAGPAAWFMVGKTDVSSLAEFTELDGTVIPDENET